MAKCNYCGCELDYAGQECPTCHSKFIECNETIGLRESKQRTKKRNAGSKKTFEELVYKKEIYRKTGDLNLIYRKFDHANDRYEEQIFNSDGTIKIDFSEPLHEHIGHGCDKTSKK